MNLHKSYPARYFDADSTRALVVQVVLQPGKILIAQDKWPESLTWKVEKVDSIVKDKDSYVLKYGGIHHLQVLEVRSEEFLKDLKILNSTVPDMRKPASAFKYVLFSLLFLFIAGLALFYFFIVPWLVNKSVNSFPKDTEIALGKTMLENFVRTEKTDPAVSHLLNEFYQQTHILSDYKIHITYVKSPVVNAFALPGGEIVVYSGILSKMNSYNELVALLGHETGHVHERHSLKLLVKQLSLGLVTGLIFQDYNNLTALLVAKATELRQLSYSRAAEEEADLFGYEAMRSTGNNPKGMVQLFEHLKQEEKQTPSIPEFMQTHPSTDKRLKDVENRLNNDKNVFKVNPVLQSKWLELKKFTGYKFN